MRLHERMWEEVAAEASLADACAGVLARLRAPGERDRHKAVAEHDALVGRGGTCCRAGRQEI